MARGVAGAAAGRGTGPLREGGAEPLLQARAVSGSGRAFDLQGTSILPCPSNPDGLNPVFLKAIAAALSIGLTVDVALSDVGRGTENVQSG